MTCDQSGRIVDFEIQEGKGDLKERIVELSEKWNNEVPVGVLIFGEGLKNLEQRRKSTPKQCQREIEENSGRAGGKDP